MLCLHPGEHLNPITDAEPTTPSSQSTRLLTECVLLEQQGIVLLQDLDGLCFGDADRRAAIGQAITVSPATVASAGKEIHDVVASGFRIVSTKCQVATGAGWRTKQSLWNRLCHCPKNGFHNSLSYFSCATCDWSGVCGIQKRTFGWFYMKRGKAA